jgi:hypothetical protein
MNIDNLHCLSRVTIGITSGPPKLAASAVPRFLPPGEGFCSAIQPINSNIVHSGKNIVDIGLKTGCICRCNE